MQSDIRALQRQINAGFAGLIKSLDRRYGFSGLSPFAFQEFEQFGLRKGNRIRAVLMLLSYMGYSRKQPSAGLCRWASSLEFIQNFILIHDDIIDCASLRRGGPSLHILANRNLSKTDGHKTGRDLALILGDIFFAAGIDLFMSIKEEPARKQRALAELMRAAVATGCGEINELLLELTDICRIEKTEIFKTYDLKTARYTFMTPLALGAILGGAPAGDLKIMARIGMLCGRAFQIRDDITELLTTQPQASKTFLADFKASKKTILLLYFMQKAPLRDRSRVADILQRTKKTPGELLQLKELFLSTGVVELAEAEIRAMTGSALRAVRKLTAAPEAKSGMQELIAMLAVSSTAN